MTKHRQRSRTTYMDRLNSLAARYHLARSCWLFPSDNKKIKENYVKTFYTWLNLSIHLNYCIDPSIALGTSFLIRKFLYVHSYLKRVGPCSRQENECHSIYTVTFFLYCSIKGFFYLHFVCCFLTFFNTVLFVPRAIKTNIKFIFSQHYHMKQK